MVITVNVENGQITRLMSDTLPEASPRRKFSTVANRAEVNCFDYEFKTCCQNKKQ